MEDAKNDENHNQSLKGLKYAVFALGSSIYPNFCSFGIYCDDSIASLGKYASFQTLIKSFRHLNCTIACTDRNILEDSY